MPQWAYDKAVGKMPLRQNHLKCNEPSDFGELTFVINGFEYTLPYDDWVEKVDNGDNYFAQVSAAQVGPSGFDMMAPSETELL